MQILGIDPGNSGAMCLLNQYGDILSTTFFQSKDGYFDLDHFLNDFRDLKFEYPDMHVYLEKVHAMPGQGVTSMFKFGCTFGMLQGVIKTYRLELNLVRPQEWMAQLHFDEDADLKPKERSKLAAQRLYPGIDLRKSLRSVNPHDGLVDALLLAEYGRRQMYEKRLQ